MLHYTNSSPLCQSNEKRLKAHDINKYKKHTLFFIIYEKEGGVLMFSWFTVDFWKDLLANFGY